MPIPAMPIPALPSLDSLLIAADNALRTLSGGHHGARPYPAEGTATPPLATRQRALSGALMRVNHVGEVCAQALYSAQALTSRDPAVRAQFEHAGRDEVDHLAWTERRLAELQARPSLLNPLWYAGAFGLGLIAGRASEAVSLGFVAATEHQVESHLGSHLIRLPADDLASRAIVRQMQQDEARHAGAAEQAGASRLPWPLRTAMRLAGRVMTTTAHYL